MKQIPLTQGKYAQVSDEDFEFLMQWEWVAETSDGNRYYAIRNVWGRKDTGERVSKPVRMHRVIAGAIKGELVDHKDGDGLNNQRDNLRICTHAENMANRRSHKRSSSMYLGVGKHRKGRWTAGITKDGESKYLGIFERAEDAAHAYNEAAKVLHGEFANLNALPAGYEVPKKKRKQWAWCVSVYLQKDRGTYRAFLSIGNEKVNIGSFGSEIEAREAGRKIMDQRAMILKIVARVGFDKMFIPEVVS